MKWIKASGRLPEKVVCIRWPDNFEDYVYAGSSVFSSLTFTDGIEWLDEASPEQGKDEVYWKQRCEAAELIIGISGTVDCEGYEQWETLKEQEPASPSTASGKKEVLIEALESVCENLILGNSEGAYKKAKEALTVQFRNVK